MADDIEARRRRLIYRSSYTGMKETDLLLGAFARRYLPAFTSEQLDRYQAVLDRFSDPEIYAWAMGQEAPPRDAVNDVTRLICEFKIDG
ncbi:MAG TPA: succinate dehydrogenase assembly factor 2 [Candidatus Cybelea sp.]|nr:succinate dehydrogenase assembly factor 2 [Candidatus Cybelea sp.]